MMVHQRPPSWISIFCHNFGVDQHFCTKFGTRVKNQQFGLDPFIFAGDMVEKPSRMTLE